MTQGVTSPGTRVLGTPRAHLSLLDVGDVGGERWAFFVCSEKGLPTVIVHQSDLSALARCAQEYGLKRAGVPSTTNSAAAYGSVMHHALSAFERLRATGVDFYEARQAALESFAFFWLPSNITAICDPVPPDGWLRGQSYGVLRDAGLKAIAEYADLIRFDDHELLATEFSFIVPVDGTWDPELDEPHFLAGSVDRLAVRHYNGHPYVAVDDYKTGQDYKFLRQNLQGTAYCYASTKPEFWMGFDDTVNHHRMQEEGFGDRGLELFTRFLDSSRRFTWISTRRMKFDDGGWRGPLDYERFALVVEQFAALVRADAYPLSVSGNTCTYCSMRNVCGGAGLPPKNHGAPS